MKKEIEIQNSTIELLHSMKLDDLLNCNNDNCMYLPYWIKIFYSKKTKIIKISCYVFWFKDEVDLKNELKEKLTNNIDEPILYNIIEETKNIIDNSLKDKEILLNILSEIRELKVMQVHITTDNFLLNETGANDDLDKFADLFASKNVPLCISTDSENLLNTASNRTETRLDVALRIQNQGGEILSHNYQVATADKLNNAEFMYEYFAASRQKLINMGLDVNGILFTSGNGHIIGSPDTARWAYSTYDYSDLYGEPYDGLEGLSSVYNRWSGTGLYDFNNDAQEIRTYIDQLIQNRDWAVLSFQGLSDVSIETLGEVLDYINSKGSDTIEIVTYSKMYDRFAEKESVIKNTVKTYYVSADGTGWDGTDINDPINLDALNTKKIKTGDTVLFKSGDTFIGSVAPQILYTNDEKIIISSYGEGARPTISA